MADVIDRLPCRGLPRSDSELLDEFARTERRHNGPAARPLDEMANRRRIERSERETLLRADLRRFENLRAEHLRWLRLSVRQFRAVLRQPPSAQREHRLAFAQDAIKHNKESVRIWSDKVADARAKLDHIRRWPAAAE